MLAGAGLDPSVQGMVGAQGPAMGIRRANSVAVSEAQGAGISANGSSVSFATGARAESSFVVTQETTEPITPLKTLGGIVDARA